MNIKGNNKNTEKTMKKIDAYSEAMRHLSSKAILRKLKKSYGMYKEEDVKHVQAVCEMVYKGVLISINDYLKIKGTLNYKPTEEKDEIIKRLQKHKRLLGMYLTAYDYLYIVGQYHGTTSVNSVQQGIEAAKKIIEFIKPFSKKAAEDSKRKTNIAVKFTKDFYKKHRGLMTKLAYS